MGRSVAPLDLVVVIPSFNQSALLAECLSAIERELEDGRLSARVVVVDNASWDDSVAVVATRFPWVTLIENEVNMGFAAACNQGAKLYACDHVLLLNSDATLAPGSLSAMLAFASEQPELGAATGRLLSPAGQERYPASHFWQRWFPPPARVHELSWVPGTCMWLRREALEAVGWLDEAFFFYNEDLDLSMRLRKAGWKLFYQPALVVRHHEGGSSKLIRARALLEGYRGALLLARKHYGKPAYLATRFGLRAEVKARLLGLRVLKLLKPSDPTVQARLEAYEAVREVLRHGVKLTAASEEPTEQTGPH